MMSGGGSASEGGLTGPKGIGGAAQSMKKGPWTAAEDAILMEYVRKHGEGNWNAVQKNSGLMRCGKSCRLRWANHLRPNLKKGSFSPDEEKIIIELHAKLGNKWARMAAQLPGRTDNEIKNYWNTRIKRRQRAGLPIYPQEIQEKAAAAFHLQHQHQHQHHQKRPQNNNSSSSLSSILASQNPSYNPSLSMFNTFNFSSAISPLQNQATSCYSDPNQQFQLLFDTNNTRSLSLPLSPTPPYAPSSTSLLNQNIPTQTMPIPSFKFSSTGNNNFHHRDMSVSSMIIGANSIDRQIEFVSGLKTELPSSQIPPKQATLATSGSGGGICDVRISNNDYDQIPNKTDSGNSGLLDALVQESQQLPSNDKFKGGQSLPDAADKRKSVADVSSVEVDGNDGVESMNMVNNGEANADNQWDDLSSSQSSIGMKARDQEPLEEMNSMDDDLMSLLNNFPLSMPLPEWYPGTNDTSNGLSSSMTGGIQDSNQRNISPAAAAATAASPDLQWSMGSGRWKNMPSIC